MADSLKAEAAKSLGWSGLSTGVRLSLQFVFSIIMARLLTPEDFGVMAVMMVLNGVVVCFIDGGFSQALIQKSQTTKEEVSAVFYFGLIISFVMALALFLCAPVFASTFEMPILAPVSRILALDFILSAFSVVQRTMLYKSLQFKTLMKVNLISSFGASILAIYLAWQQWGVWSLVAYTLAGSLLATISLWWGSSWRPERVFHVRALRPLFRFGGFILLASLLETLFGRINTLLIGKFYSVRDLGFYSRAESIQSMPTNFYLGVVNQVTLPLFATISDDPLRLQAGFRKATRFSFYLYAPTVIGVFVAADVIVKTLFGPQWLPSIPYLQVFSLGSLFWLPRLMNINYLKATGRSRAFFMTELFQKAMGVMAALATVRFGILPMLFALMAVNFVTYFLTAWVAGVEMTYEGFQQIWDSVRSIVAALIMGLGVWAVSWISAFPNAVVLAGQITVGALVYLGACHVLRVSEQQEILRHGWEVARRKLPLPV